MPEIKSNVIQSQSSNLNYLTDNALRIRLETKELLTDFEMFLKGMRIVIKEDSESGKRWAEEQKITDPLVNEKGLQAFMAKLTLLLNASTVQGFWKEDQYHNNISIMRMQLSYDIAVNNRNWGIKEENQHYLCNCIMDTLKCFLSRLIDNWERRTLMPLSRGEQSTSTEEIEQKNKIFNR